ncbi:MAG: thioredoxin domain-containing protein [Ferruginibacter sp.]
MIKIKEVAVFETKILKGSGLQIVRFCASWSGPCQIMGPIYEEMFSLYKDAASFYKIDIDEVPLLKEQLSIVELPTILIYKNGAVVEVIVGLIARDSLIARLEKVIK